MSTATLSLDRGTEYRVLSVRQPWAWAIVHGGKDVENRSWHTNYRGLLLIHASGRTPRAHLAEDLPIIGDLTGREPDAIERELVYGAILGAAELEDTVEDSDSEWALDDHVHWCLTKPRALAKPITVKGKLNVWRWKKT